MKPENAYFHTVQNFLSSSLLSKNISTKIYRTVILSVVLYECETWSLTLRKECRLRVLRDEITEEWRKLHNEELNDLYSSPNIFRVIKTRRMRWAGHVTRMGKRRGVYRILVGRLEGITELGRPRRRWENNIKKVFSSGMGKHGPDCSGSGYGQVASACECSNEPSGSTKCGELLD